MTWAIRLIKTIAHALGFHLPPPLQEFEAMKAQRKSTWRLRAAIRAANNDFRRELQRLEGEL